MTHRAVLLPVSRLIAPLFLLLAALAIACGDNGHTTATPSTGGDDRALAATAIPEPSPTPWPILGRVLPSMIASCALGLIGPELTITYGAEIEGQAEITRIQLLVDKEVREDTAHLAERAYYRDTRLSTRPNRMVTVQLLVETRGAEPTPQTIHLVRCPRVPTLPRA